MKSTVSPGKSGGSNSDTTTPALPDQHRQPGTDAVREFADPDCDEQRAKGIQGHEDADRHLALSLVEGVKRNRDPASRESRMGQRAHQQYQIYRH